MLGLGASRYQRSIRPDQPGGPARLCRAGHDDDGQGLAVADRDGRIVYGNPIVSANPSLAALLRCQTQSCISLLEGVREGASKRAGTLRRISPWPIRLTRPLPRRSPALSSRGCRQLCWTPCWQAAGRCPWRRATNLWVRTSQRRTAAGSSCRACYACTLSPRTGARSPTATLVRGTSSALPPPSQGSSTSRQVGASRPSPLHESCTSTRGAPSGRCTRRSGRRLGAARTDRAISTGPHPLAGGHRVRLHPPAHRDALAEPRRGPTGWGVGRADHAAGARRRGGDHARDGRAGAR